MLAGTPQEAQGPSTNTVSVEVTGGVGRDTISFTLVARKVNRLPRMAGATHSPLPTWIGITGGGHLGVLAPALPLTRTVSWMPTSLVVPDGDAGCVEPFGAAGVGDGVASVVHVFEWTMDEAQAGRNAAFLRGPDWTMNLSGTEVLPLETTEADPPVNRSSSAG